MSDRHPFDAVGGLDVINYASRSGDAAWQASDGRKGDIQPSPPLAPVAPATPDAILHVNEAGRVVITPRRSEFESLRRTLYNALDKLDQLERRVLTTT